MGIVKEKCGDEASIYKKGLLLKQAAHGLLKGLFLGFFAADQAAAQAEEMIRAKRKRHIQAGDDDDVNDLCGHVADHAVHGKAYGFKWRDVALIQVIEVGLKQV